MVYVLNAHSFDLTVIKHLVEAGCVTQGKGWNLCWLLATRREICQAGLFHLALDLTNPKLNSNLTLFASRKL
jgi:hypothetical protein